MKLLTRFRGPRLPTKLALLGLALLVVPWFSYQQLVEMERLLIQGQSQAQLLTAEGISTLFNGREDLFDDLPTLSVLGSITGDLGTGLSLYSQVSPAVGNIPDIDGGELTVELDVALPLLNDLPFDAVEIAATGRIVDARMPAIIGDLNAYDKEDPIENRKKIYEKNDFTVASMHHYCPKLLFYRRL